MSAMMGSCVHTSAPLHKRTTVGGHGGGGTHPGAMRMTMLKVKAPSSAAAAAVVVGRSNKGTTTNNNNSNKWSSSLVVRCSASSSSSSPRDEELKKMRDYTQGLGAKLEQSASSSTAAAAVLSMNGDERDLQEVTLDEYWDAVKTLSSGNTLLVMDFYTQWCGPCKLMKPTLCDWAEELEGRVYFRKFEASKENAPIGKELQIKSVPTLIVYKNGEEIGRVVGKKEDVLREMLDQHVLEG